MKRPLLYLSVAIALLGLALVIFRIITEPKLSIFSDVATGVNLKYSTDSTAPQPLTEQDKKDKIILRAREKNGEKPFQITLRYEEGLRGPAQLSKTEPLELVLNGAERTLPQRFPEYKQLSVIRLSRAGKQGAEINFKYKGPSKEIIHQRLLILMRTDDRAVYLAAQAKKEDFENVQKIFDPIFKTIRFAE